MKTSISSYSFSALMREGKTDQLGCVKRAKELGFDAIEFTDLTPPSGVSETDYAKAIKAEADSLNLTVSCYSVYADLLNGSDGNLNAEVERLKRKVDVAEALGAKLMRHDATGGFKPGERKFRGYNDVLDRLASGCRAVTEYANTKGIRTCTENHGRFSQDSLRVEALIGAVADENFGALVDTGNFLCADEDPVTAVGRMAPYAFNAHVKDFILKQDFGFDPGEGFFRSRGGAYLLGTVLGHGAVPLVQCVSALKLAGYDGFLTLEFEGTEEISYALRAGAAYIKRLANM